MIIDTVIEVEAPGDLDRALELAKYKPVRVVFADRDLFELLEPRLRKLYIIYTIVRAGDRHVEIVLYQPEALIRLDPRLEAKSYGLANPWVISYLIRVSQLEGVLKINTPGELLDLFNRYRVGYKFLELNTAMYMGRAYLVLRSGVVAAVVYQDSQVYWGRVAFRIIFYRGPYLAYIYDIDYRRLTKP